MKNKFNLFAGLFCVWTATLGEFNLNSKINLALGMINLLIFFFSVNKHD
jgi:hypothetical protein